MTAFPSANLPAVCEEIPAKSQTPPNLVPQANPVGQNYGPDCVEFDTDVAIQQRFGNGKFRDVTPAKHT